MKTSCFCLILGDYQKAVKMARVVNIKLGFTDQLFYNFIVLIK